MESRLLRIYEHPARSKSTSRLQVFSYVSQKVFTELAARVTLAFRLGHLILITAAALSQLNGKNETLKLSGLLYDSFHLN